MIHVDNGKVKMQGIIIDLLFEIEEVMRQLLEMAPEEHRDDLFELMIKAVIFAAIPEDKIREQEAIKGIRQLLRQMQEESDEG